MPGKTTKAKPAGGRGQAPADPWTTPAARKLRGRLLFIAGHPAYEADEVEAAMPQIEQEAVAYDRGRLQAALARLPGEGAVPRDAVAAILAAPAHLRPAPRASGADDVKREYEELLRNPQKRHEAEARIAATVKRLGGDNWHRASEGGLDPEIGGTRVDW